MARKDNSKLKELIAEYGIKDMNDVHDFVKMLTAETIQAALDAELDSELGYSKYDYKQYKAVWERLKFKFHATAKENLNRNL